MTTHRLPRQSMQARVMPESMRATGSGVTVDITWSTGAKVRRYDWWEDEEFIEELSMEEDSVDLSRLNTGAPVLRDHRQALDSVIGVVERAWLEDGAGRASIRFSQRADVQPVIQDITDGVLRNISVGYRIDEMEKHLIPGQLPIYRATKWQPLEVSIVAVPADAGAQVRTDPELTPVHIRGTTMPDSVKQTDKPEAESVNEFIDTQEVQRKAAAAERKRISEIRKFAAFSRTSMEQTERYIEDGISLEQAKDDMLRAWSAKVDAETSRGHAESVSDETDKRHDAAVSAILGKAGLLKDRAALQGNPFAGFRLLDYARDCAERAGVRTSGLGQMDIVGRAFTQSSSDFPVILEASMHKALIGAYATAPDTWRRFCRVGSVSDFRAWKRLRTGSIGNLDKVNELQEFTHKAIPDGEAESVQAETRGNLINVSRQAIVNDDLGYFLGLTADLGRAAARTIEAKVYATLIANPTMSDGHQLMSSNHGNIQTSGAAPSVATIEAGRQAMAVQTDVSGNDYLDLRPAIWLGPVSLGGTARTINEAQYDVDLAYNTKNFMTPNKVRGLFRDVIDSPRLSGNPWYMLADPAIAPVFEVVFLDGNENPFLDMQDGFSVDGVRYKVRLDFGVGVVDYRGIYQNDGA